ncbi:hypothetical protein [Paraburkholderia susongensis]|uniref:Poly A polymerase head domain-containing protein n=1 Tax=Paraburkholderia susongensis TaxID=1515439 RepID=A0A1X7KRE6_9BURK|nr:hypothetical protein [Paraburkholderia susongensis]SMG43374.1 Poly A polymerase head domain-containing protein [Paraburkholderia susongensis]
MNLIQQFDEALARLQAVGVQGLIAGGAVRDHLLNRPVKDIDVFVPHSEGIQRKLQEAFGVLHVNPLISAEYAGAGGEVEHVYEINISSDPFDPDAGRPPLQVIVLASGLDPEERARHHDFGICQCWYRGNGQFGQTLAFTNDLMHKRFTLSHCEDQQQFDRSMRRWARFSERFEGFYLYVPVEFAEYREDAEVFA